MLNDSQTVRAVWPHAYGPGSEEMPDWHQWITNGEMVKANSRGIPNPRMHEANWVKVVCNNPDCAAWALVDVAYLVERVWPVSEDMPNHPERG